MSKLKVNKMKKLSFFTSEHYSEMLTNFALYESMPISRVIAYLLDNAINEGVPFVYNLTKPEESIDFAYANEAGKFISYMNKLDRGMGLDMLMLVRHDIGIPDKGILLSVFYEALKTKLIKPVKPTTKVGRSPFPDGYKYYLSSATKKKTDGKIKKDEAAQFAEYLKYKKKFEAKGEV